VNQKLGDEGTTAAAGRWLTWGSSRHFAVHFGRISRIVETISVWDLA